VWHCGFKQRDEFLNWIDCGKGGLISLAEKDDGCGDILMATALPAIPLHPKPEDVSLIHRYMAEKITPRLFSCFDGSKVTDIFVSLGQKTAITKAIYKEEIIEIALDRRGM
jgi:hypothetical protein